MKNLISYNTFFTSGPGSWVQDEMKRIASKHGEYMKSYNP